MPAKLLISGAAGHLGQLVLTDLLESQKVSPGDIIAGTRNPQKLAAWASEGVAVRKLDFEDPSTFAPALQGAQRMLLISTDAVDRPGRRLGQHKAAIAAARAAQIRHVVYTSMPNPADTLVTFAPDHLGTEQALAESGLSFTILRMNWYMQNLLTGLSQALTSGQWHVATGEGRVGYVAREDCASAAAAALTAADEKGARLDVTGPEAFSMSQIASIVRELTGRPLAVMQQTDDEKRRALGPAGLPAPVVELIVSIDASIRAGKLDVVSNTVQKLTGKAPKTLRDFLAANKSVLSPQR
jgi:NAD(P)H dehydrogenase (quinone)